jgi:hypothetical protein
MSIAAVGLTLWSVCIARLRMLVLMTSVAEPSRVLERFLTTIGILIKLAEQKEQKRNAANRIRQSIINVKKNLIKVQIQT